MRVTNYLFLRSLKKKPIILPKTPDRINIFIHGWKCCEQIRLRYVVEFAAKLVNNVADFRFVNRISIRVDAKRLLWG